MVQLNLSLSKEKEKQFKEIKKQAERSQHRK
jgi:hypothetical protein